MYTANEVLSIPTYAFEPDEATGNHMFRIHKSDCVANYKRSDFLIPHRKGYYFMAFVKKSDSRHWIDNVAYQVKPDTFYFTTPQQINMKEAAEAYTGFSLSFSEEFLMSNDNGALKSLPVFQNPHNGHEIRLTEKDVLFMEDSFERILAEYHSKDAWQHNMLQAYVKVLFIYVSRLYTEQFSDAALFPERILLSKYLAKIEESFTTLHEVGAYADMLHISAGHLSEVVKAQSGKPAIAHIHERLILEAKRMLFHTDHAIKEIAYELGFEDASYFNRFFKRHTSYTPVLYRENFRKMYH